MKSLLASFGLLFLFIIAFFVGIDYMERLDRPTIENATPTEIISSIGASTTTPAFAIHAEQGIAQSVIIDFGICSGTHTVSYAFGSSRFSFKGPVGDTCAYVHSFEIEMGESPAAYCFVPMALGKKSFKVHDVGIDMTELALYCSNE